MANSDDRFAHAHHHDLGGRDEYVDCPVDRVDRPDEFGTRVDALRVLLGAKGILSTHELRRGVEQIPRDEYLSLQYYERWLHGIAFVLKEKGLIGPGDLA